MSAGLPAAANATVPDTPANSSTAYQEPYRPQFHYSPAQNWMNDPNGLIFYKGQYHLFYQYNKFGTTGGNASWGHAVSMDLVHWTELPVAIPVDANEEVWSGSVVLDKTNSSGFGTVDNPALVAVYTSAPKATGIQRQSVAYSTDGGTTWTKYSGNPVLDIGSHNFRDPKVFWYEPTKSWRMAVVLSDQHKVALYSSPDLKSWKQLSQFGPDGATNAVWECPDFFPMALDGNKNDTRWVMSVNVGGKAQYFVGSFDGTTFTNSDKAYVPPAGTVLNDFEGSDYGQWATTGTAFGTGPAKNENGVTGNLGNGLVDSYGGGDDRTGTLTSPAFTVDKKHLNFLIAGGNHPHVEGGSTAPPPGQVFEDFEGPALPGWTGTGDLANIVPSRETLSGQQGSQVLDTCQANCDGAKGTLTSPSFTISSNFIDFLIGGGNHPMSGANPTAVNLVIDGAVVASASGNNSGSLDWASFDVSQYQGKQGTLQFVDQNDGSTGWGHMMVDDIIFSNTRANPWDAQTGVNLLVDGQIVRTATGNDSSALDWASWDLSDLQGKQAQIQIVDRNTGGWGHILADQFTLSDTAATSALQRAHWIDQGKDFYAAVSYNDAPGGKRIMVGWMNNWDYANDIPTSPWRGAQALPRELKLQTVNGVVQLTQQPVEQVNDLVGNVSFKLKDTTLAAGVTDLGPKASGAAYRMDLTLDPKTASNAGVKVRTGAGTATEIGYDAKNQQLSIDRTHSGNVGFNASFPSIDRAPVTVKDGKIALHIYVDWSSVEVFTDDGTLAMTDQIFPDASSTGVQLFSTGGNAVIDTMTIAPIPSTWTPRKAN